MYLSVIWPIDPETLALRFTGNTVLSTQRCTTLKCTMRWDANGQMGNARGQKGKVYSIHTQTLINHVEK